MTDSSTGSDRACSDSDDDDHHKKKSRLKKHRKERKRKRKKEEGKGGSKEKKDQDAPGGDDVDDESRSSGSSRGSDCTHSRDYHRSKRTNKKRKKSRDDDRKKIKRLKSKKKKTKKASRKSSKDKYRKRTRKRRIDDSSSIDNDSDSTTSSRSISNLKRKKRRVSGVNGSGESSEHGVEAGGDQSAQKSVSSSGITRHVEIEQTKKEKLKHHDSNSIDENFGKQQQQRRVMVPMTREEYEKKQSEIREVYDPLSGRTRLVRGDGEIIERIVSRNAHQQINQQATRGDGSSFARSIFQQANNSHRR